MSGWFTHPEHKMPISREIKEVIFYNVIKIRAPVCMLVYARKSRLGHRDQRTSRSFPYFCSGKKSAPAYLGLQGWLISESSQSIHLTLPQNCQKGNFSSSERGELTIKTDPYKNSYLKSIFFFPLFLSQKNNAAPKAPRENRGFGTLKPVFFWRIWFSVLTLPEITPPL